MQNKDFVLKNIRINKIRLIFLASTAVIFPLFFLSINLKDCYAIENLPQWWAPTKPVFEFNNPGARSRGMGGAFVGRADDATAVVANPAGLSQLPGLQFYVEGRFSTWDTLDEPWAGLDQARFEPLFSLIPPPLATTGEVEIRNDDQTITGKFSDTFSSLTPLPPLYTF